MEYGPHLVEIDSTDQFCAVLIESGQDFWRFMYMRFCFLMETCFPGSLSRT